MRTAERLEICVSGEGQTKGASGWERNDNPMIAAVLDTRIVFTAPVDLGLRFTVRLDHGELLVAVRQNMHAPGRAQGFEGRRVRLAWSPDHAYVLKTGTTGEEK